MVPKEKKSTAFWLAEVDVEVTLESLSKDTFALPFASDGGRNAVGGNSVVFFSGINAALWSSTASRLAAGVVGYAVGPGVLNTSPGPVFPPRTRWVTGFICFGAGNMDSRDDAPAPDIRAFFTGGSSSSTFPELRRLGRAMVIFFGRFVLTGTVVEFGETGFDFDGAGNSDSNDDLNGAFAGVSIRFSSSLSLPLP
jgi:hypothetical protein